MGCSSQTSTTTPQSEPKNPPSSWWPDSAVLDSEIATGFTTGIIGGSTFHFLKGFLRRPDRRSRGRFSAGVRRARARSLRVGGAFAAAFGLGSVVDNSLQYYRERDDDFNFGVSGAAMAAALMARRGATAASCAAVGFGGFVFLLRHYGDDLSQWIDKKEEEEMKIRQLKKNEFKI